MFTVIGGGVVPVTQVLVHLEKGRKICIVVLLLLLLAPANNISAVKMFQEVRSATRSC